LTGALANPGVIAGIGRIGDAIAGVFTADRVTGGINRVSDAFSKLFSQDNLTRASGIARARSQRSRPSTSEPSRAD
jgi:hypothetical protein